MIFSHAAHLHNLGKLAYGFKYLLVDFSGRPRCATASRQSWASSIPLCLSSASFPGLSALASPSGHIHPALDLKEPVYSHHLGQCWLRLTPVGGLSKFPGTPGLLRILSEKWC